MYETVAFDYHSPLKNFGEMLTLGELEQDACYDLCTKPMQMCNIKYETEELVQQIISLTGMRPNLITLVCNEIIRGLAITDRLIRQKDLDRALASRDVTDELAILPLLEETGEGKAETEQANRLDRIIIYTCLKHESLTEELLLEWEIQRYPDI